MRYALKHVDHAGVISLCELVDGICYDTYATMAEATNAAIELNVMARAHNWQSRYYAAELPEGIVDGKDAD